MKAFFIVPQKIMRPTFSAIRCRKKIYFVIVNLLLLMLCSVGSLAQVDTFSQGFNSGSFPPAGWTLVNHSGGLIFSFATLGIDPTCSPEEGAGMVEFNSFAASGNVNDLVTPSINPTGTCASCPQTVTFWMYRDTAYPSSADKIDVFINTSATSTGGTLLGTVNRSASLAPATTDGWHQYTFSYTTGISAGTYYLIFRATSAYGDNIYLDSVTWNQFSGTISGPTNVCAGSSIPLTDTTAGGVWSSSDTSVASVGSSTGLVSGIAAGSSVITYLVGSSYSTYTVHVNTVPPAAISGLVLVCPGLTIPMSDAVGGGYWSSSSTGVAIIGSDGIVSGVSSGTSTITYSTGCGTPATTLITVKSNIASHNVITTPDTLCNGPDFHISACGVSSAYSVTTYFGDNTSSNTALTSGHADVFHTYTTPGTYSLKQVLFDGTIPQDSISFSYEYLFCRTLPLKLYVDLDGDCIRESAEPYNSVSTLVQVDSNSIPIDTISATAGLYYQAHGPMGTIYSFSIISGIYVASCPLSAVIYDTIVSTVNTYPIKYCGLSCVGAGFDLAVTDASPVTGPHDQIGYIYVWNNGCEPTDGTVTVYYDKRYSSSFNMRGGSMAPISQTDSSATWDMSGLSYTSGPLGLNYQVWAPSGSLASGDTVFSRVTVSPTSGDVNVSNNIEIIKDTINDCEDPNQIFVSPSGCIPGTATKLQYTILFTNVGTDTAFNVYVMDTLPNSLDPASLRLIMASNTMNIVHYNEGGNNIVKFDFPGINLLDTNVCKQCSGQVVYTINTLADLPIGTTIFNHAGVFFDDNPVVLTDTVENVIGNCIATTSVKNIPAGKGNVQIFPNPTTNELTIKIQGVILSGAEGTFTITNSIGQQLMQQSITDAQTKVNVSMLPAGLYYITFRGDNGTEVRKFVKE